MSVYENIKLIDKIKKYYLYFMMYSMIGWIFEEFLEIVVFQRGYTDRGILFGPYCPVYGISTIIFILTLSKLLKHKTKKEKILMIPIIFLGCALIATSMELIASYLCEWTLGTWSWKSYKNYKINFQGRIALIPSLTFGTGGVLFLYVLQPIFEKYVNKLNMKLLNIIVYGLLSIFIIDIIFKILNETIL